jgi:hypothetical protein
MPRTINATDLKHDLASFPDDRYASGFVFLVGIGPWSMSEAFASTVLKVVPCHVCRGRRLKRNEYCLGCDRTGIDGLCSLPGLDVDEAPDEEWSATPRVYRPRRSDLAGGVQGNGNRKKPSRRRRA